MSDWWEKSQRKHLENSICLYEEAIALGIAKEQARIVLPEGMTPSVMYMKGSIRSWFHYCSLRMDMGTQKEHRLIAADVWRDLSKHFTFLPEVKL